MKSALSDTLRRLLTDTRRELAEDKASLSFERVKQMVREAAPVRSFTAALASGNALIAEIKERSPSQGKMRPENVAAAIEAYKESPVVKAISFLTSRTNFGENMRVERLALIKQQTGKPVLRKDFIIEEYQVYQSRAYGADAILLMANVLEPDEMKRLSDPAFELGMNVLFETHRPEEVDELPSNARLIGINCRNFQGGLRSSFAVARFFRQWLGAKTDRSVDLERFGYIGHLPAQSIKVAESGVSAQNCRAVFDLGFQSILAGTSLLMDPRGIRAGLADFERAILGTAEAGVPCGPAPIPQK